MALQTFEYTYIHQVYIVYFFRKNGIIPIDCFVALYFNSVICHEHLFISIKITLATPSVRVVRHQLRSTDSGVRPVRIQVSGWQLSTM